MSQICIFRFAFSPCFFGDFSNGDIYGYEKSNDSNSTPIVGCCFAGDVFFGLIKSCIFSSVSYSFFFSLLFSCHISYFLYCSLNFAKHVVFPTPASPINIILYTDDEENIFNIKYIIYNNNFDATLSCKHNYIRIECTMKYGTSLSLAPHPVQEWSMQLIKGITRRRYEMCHSAIEIYFIDNTSINICLVHFRTSIYYNHQHKQIPIDITK